MARILIADDEDGVPEFTAEVLADEGHEVDQALERQRLRGLRSAVASGEDEDERPLSETRSRASAKPCNTRHVRRTSSTLLLATLLAVSAFACKKNKQEETVEPQEEEDWTPDESFEPEAQPAAPAEPEMSEEEKLEKAKEFYAQAEEKAAAGDWAEATNLYEKAYYLVPGKHGFALKVGNAADEAGECARAKQYLEHFVTYATEDKYKKDRKKAEKRIAELDC